MSPITSRCHFLGPSTPRSSPSPHGHRYVAQPSGSRVKPAMSSISWDSRSSSLADALTGCCNPVGQGHVHAHVNPFAERISPDMLADQLQVAQLVRPLDLADD